MQLNERHIEEIKKLCKINKVKSLSAFGSVTREDFNEDSDIDMVVDFEEEDPYRYTDLYFDLKSKLEELLKRQVDLIEERGIRKQIFQKRIR